MLRNALAMLNSEEIFGTVAFVADASEKEPRFRGTVFFIDEVAASGTTKLWGYMVTARHVAERLASGQYSVRLNAKDRGAHWMNFAGARWWIHPHDATIDVAVLRWFPPSELIRYKRWNTGDFVTRELIDGGGVKIGDDTHTIGLFRAQPGVSENTPVVRFGNVAMIPKDPVKTAFGPMEAVLIESRSLGGLSGSPVVVTETMRHRIGEAYFKGIGRVRLLGLVHGHQDLVKPGATQDPEDAVVNSGIVVVVPAQKILDIIQQEEVTVLKQQELPRLLAGRLIA